MTGSDVKLKDILENEDTLKKIAEIADSLKDKKETDSSREEGEKASSPTSGIADILPVIMGAMSGDGQNLDPDRLNLIKAIKPYLAESHGQSFDRAIRMANLCKAAKSAMSLLGR